MICTTARIDLDELYAAFAEQGWQVHYGFLTEPHSATDPVWSASEVELALAPLNDPMLERSVITLTIRTPIRVETDPRGPQTIAALEPRVLEALNVLASLREAVGATR